jgi:hypothetical protein
MPDRALAYCQKGHRLAWLADDGEPTIHYWVATFGLDDVVEPRESFERVAGVEPGRRELMCPHRHGKKLLEVDFADLLPGFDGAPPLILG